jgi:hypothetical protein
MTTKTFPMPERFPFFEKFTDEQMRASYKRCAEVNRKAEARARATGKKVGGITADGWQELAEKFEYYAANFSRA